MDRCICCSRELDNGAQAVMANGDKKIIFTSSTADSTKKFRSFLVQYREYRHGSYVDCRRWGENRQQ